MKILRKLFLLLFISIFAYSTFNLLSIYKEDKEAEKVTEIAREAVTIEKIVKEDKRVINVDWKKLKKQNKDCIGWVYVPNTHINHPIIQSKDNDYWLYRSFDGTYNVNGCIFLSENCDGFKEQNTMIYGHNMLNGTMFSDLTKFLSKEFLNKTPYVYIATPEKEMKLKVFSAYDTYGYTNSYVYKSNNFKENIEEMWKDSSVEADKPPSNINKIITLSTCSDDYRNRKERFVIHCYEVKK